MRNELVRDIRHFKGMTQKEFAKWLGVSYSTIAVVEAEHRNASEHLQAAISRKFDVNNEDFKAYLKRRNNAREYFLNNY